VCEDQEFWRLSRRSIIAGGVALLGLSAIRSDAAHGEEQRFSSTPPNAIPPTEALNRLKLGNARYADGQPKETDFSPSRASKTDEQFPIAAILCCSDSPVPPEIVFDQAPGALFVVRDAGNIVTNDSVASFEFAVNSLTVPLLMVLGHSDCATVAAALQTARERDELPGHMDELVTAIEPAVIAAHGRHPSDLLAVTIEENVRLNVKRLLQDSELLSEALSNNKLAVSGGVHDLSTGKVRLI
jgi:carbonic anhydrase